MQLVRLFYLIWCSIFTAPLLHLLRSEIVEDAHHDLRMNCSDNVLTVWSLRCNA